MSESEKDLFERLLSNEADEAADILTQNGTVEGPSPASLLFLVGRAAAFDEVEINFVELLKYITMGYEEGKKLMNETVEQQN